MKERLQKLLAQANIASRRASEELITRGRVRVNGVVAHLGDQADPAKDVIEVNGTRLNFPKRERVCIALNKPKHVLTTDKPHRTDKRKTVMDYIDRDEHLFSIGRLDADSEGLVVMTNDGELAQRLSHPRFRHSKTYRVEVFGLPLGETLDRWRTGIFLEEGKTAPCLVEVIKGSVKGSTLRIIMTEGKKRQIRRVASALGHPVQRLTRTHIGLYALGELRVLTAKDILALSTPSPEIRLLRAQTRSTGAKRSEAAGEAVPERRSVRVKPTDAAGERRRSPRAAREESVDGEQEQRHTPRVRSSAARESADDTRRTPRIGARDGAEETRRTPRVRSSDAGGSEETRRTPRTRASDSVGKRRAPRIARPAPPEKARRSARSASAETTEGDTEQRRPSRSIKPGTRDGGASKSRSPRTGRSTTDDTRRTPRVRSTDASDVGTEQRRPSRFSKPDAGENKTRSPRAGRATTDENRRPPRFPKSDASDSDTEQRRPPRVRPADADDDKRRSPRKDKLGAPDAIRRTPRPASSGTADEKVRPPRVKTSDTGEEEKRPPRVRKTYPPRKNSTDVHRQRKQNNRKKTGR